MFNEFWLETLNKCLNFGCLIGVLVYISKKYIVPYLKEIMQQKAYEIAVLEDEINQNSKEQEKVQKEIEDFKKYSNTLLEKITCWQEALHKKNMLHAQELDRIALTSQDYLKKRADGLCKNMLQRTIAPEIFIQTKKEINLFFQNHDAQKKYMARIFDTLQKDNA